MKNKTIMKLINSFAPLNIMKIDSQMLNIYIFKRFIVPLALKYVSHNLHSFQNQTMITTHTKNLNNSSNFYVTIDWNTTQRRFSESYFTQ